MLTPGLLKTGEIFKHHTKVKRELTINLTENSENEQFVRERK
jgi:hypothetical protein